MATLYHATFCPQSRFVRLILGELGISPSLVEERVWERRRAFLELNPAGTTPVLVENEGIPLPGAGVIAEYLDETRGLGMGDRRLLPDQPADRANVRRLLDWFNGKMFDEVTSYLMTEKINKRFMPLEQGGGAPDMAAIRAAFMATMKDPEFVKEAEAGNFEIDPVDGLRRVDRELLVKKLGIELLVPLRWRNETLGMVLLGVRAVHGVLEQIGETGCSAVG